MAIGVWGGDRRPRRRHRPHARRHARRVGGVALGLLHQRPVRDGVARRRRGVCCGSRRAPNPERALRPDRRPARRGRRRPARARRRRGRPVGVDAARRSSPASSALAVLFPIFLYRSAHHPRPLLDLDLFRLRSFSAGVRRPGALHRVLLRLAGADAVVPPERLGLVAAGRRLRPGAVADDRRRWCRPSPAGPPTASATAAWSPLGTCLSAMGMLWWVLAIGPEANYVRDVLPGMILLGLGGGTGFATLTGAIMRDVPVPLLLDGRRRPQHHLPARQRHRHRHGHRPRSARPRTAGSPTTPARGSWASWGRLACAVIVLCLYPAHRIDGEVWAAERRSPYRQSGMTDLTGHVALVTGGNSGIGLGMASGLARAGAVGRHLGHEPGQERRRRRAARRPRAARSTSSSATCSDEAQIARVVRLHRRRPRQGRQRVRQRRRVRQRAPASST